MIWTLIFVYVLRIALYDTNVVMFCLALNITRSFSSVTQLEGNSITLSCTPSILEIVVLWTHNGTDIMQRNDISFSPPLLNHYLIISNPTLRDSGVFTCRAAIEDTLIEQNISMNIIAGNMTCCVIYIRYSFQH